mgnify:CR=1 FL=1
MGNAVEVDVNPRDGITDYSRSIFNTNGNDLYSTMYPKFDRVSFMAYGEYTLDDNSNTTLFFEFQKGKREVYSNFGSSQLAPWVDADYKYNVCNPESEIGFDCNAMGGYIYANPDFMADSNAYYERLYGPSTNYGFRDWWGVDIDPVTGEADISVSYFCYNAYRYGTSCVDNAGAINTRPFISIIGDLIESYFKRINKIKDSSNYLPGHGGFFDRFDSFIASIIMLLILSFTMNLWKLIFLGQLGLLEVKL